MTENLPNSIEELNLGYYFYLELDNLPNSIKIIKFNSESKYDNELNNLPENLELLELPANYNLLIKNWKNNIFQAILIILNLWANNLILYNIYYLN